MPKLNKDLLREKSIREFLQAMGVNMHGVRLTCAGDWFSISSNTAEQTLEAADRISKIVSPEAPVKLSLLAFAQLDIATSECDSLSPQAATLKRRACQLFLDEVKEHCSSLQFYPETNSFKIPISRTMFSQDSRSHSEMINHYAALFKTLANCSIQLREEGILFEEGVLSINYESVINKFPQNVLIISGLNERHSPLILFNIKVLALSKLFYAQQQNANGTITITPYFYVPNYVPPNHYHFCVVDIARGAFNKTTNKDRFFTIEQQGELIAFNAQTCQPGDHITVDVFDEKSLVAAIDFPVALPSMPKVASKSILANFTLLANPCSRINPNPKETNNTQPTTDEAETHLRARL